MTNRTIIRKRAWIAVIGLFIGFGVCLLFISSTTFAANTTYYVNNLPDSNCNNAGAGTSTTEPWCDFIPVNNHGAFGPGDKILLARGATWNQQMTITGEGTSTNLIELGAYGIGNRPIVKRNGVESDRVIKLTNPSYWLIQDLEISHAGSGIYVYYTTIGHNGLYFNNIFVHDITGIHQSSHGGMYDSGPSGPADRIWNSGGIQITGTVTLTSPSQYVLRTLRLDNIEGTHNLNSISLDFDNGGQWGVTLSGGATASANILQDVIINHAYLHDDNNSANGCDEGMRFNNVNSGIVMNSIFDNEGSCYSYSGTAAIILMSMQNSVFVNNIITNTPNTGSYDMVGVDFEYKENEVSFRNNYFGGNAGNGLSFLSIWGDYSNNHEVVGNVFVDNGYGSIRRAGNSDPIPPNGIIRDNIYSESRPFLHEDGADFSGFSLINNRNVPLAADIYHAASQFSDIQGQDSWSYQSYDGTSWSNLAYYDSASRAWQPSASVNIPRISIFEQYPANCAECKVARAWTAPKSGIVRIRGQVLKSDLEGGDGVTARITKNGTQIWPSNGDQTIDYNDRYGVEQVLDGILVTAGDVIRFEVSSRGDGNNESDLTSWVPTVAYTNSAAAFNSLDNNVSGNWINQFGRDGYQLEVGNGFGAAKAPKGDQTAFIQAGGSIQQSLLLSAGNYTVSFQAAKRNLGGNQSLAVYYDTTLIGSFTSTSSDFTSFTTSNFTATAGTHTIKFVGTTGDDTVFIDDIKVSQEIPNGGFETPITANFTTGPMTNGWIFEVGSGIQTNGSDYGAAKAPEGNQTAFIQSSSSISQSLFLPDGSYSVSFYAAKRTTYGGTQSFDVYYDTTKIGSFTPTSGNFTAFTTNSFTAAAGTHTIKFVGTTHEDNTAFVDAVRIISNGEMLENTSFEMPDTTSVTHGPMTYGWTFDSGSGVQTNDAIELPPYVNLSLSGLTGRTVWQAESTDPRALVQALGVKRTAAEVYANAGNILTYDLDFTDSFLHPIAIYMVDWNHDGLKQNIWVEDEAGNLLTDTKEISDFGGGKYYVFEAAGHVKVRIAATAGERAVSSGIFFGLDRASSMITVNRTYTEPTIDGVIHDNEWNTADVIEMNYDKQVTNGVGTFIGGTSTDLNGKLQLLWDTNGLYVAGTVKDDDYYNPYHIGDPLHNNDVIQLLFDPMNERSAGIEDAYIIDLVPTTGSDHTGPAAWFEHWQWNNADPLAGVNVAGALTSEGYTLEAFIPWSVLRKNGESFQPDNGSVMGLGLMIVDFKENGQLRGILTNFGKRKNTIENASTYLSAILVDNDRSAPVTTDDAPADWVNKDVTVTLSASDNSSGVFATYYTVDNGAMRQGSAVTITSEGTHTISYWSVDRAGNAETPHTVIVKIDKTAPSLNVTLDKTQLWPPNNKMIPIQAIVTSDDLQSGIESITLTSITSNNGGDAEDIEGMELGTPDYNFKLRATKSKGEERIYTITYTAMDKAGNQTNASVQVKAPHNM
ncbi:OmpL47-type beta-barrel domain-containing protein [Paenibacillus sp. GCM10027626]|uniref:OmpL47-type beta-barrel domain-containing protein n=1 Tax=Paenibacillus sp. GCM10027626 TaxID=3273411 RepID=UPI0036406AED